MNEFKVMKLSLAFSSYNSMFNSCVSGVWYILRYFLHTMLGKGLALVLHGALLLSQHHLLRRFFLQ